MESNKGFPPFALETSKRNTYQKMWLFHFIFTKNEHRRRIEVLDEMISKEDMEEVVNKIIQKSFNSEFNVEQIREL